MLVRCCLGGLPPDTLAYVGVQTGCTKCWELLLKIELDLVCNHLCISLLCKCYRGMPEIKIGHLLSE